MSNGRRVSARAKALIVAAGQITNPEDLAEDPVWAQDPVEKSYGGYPLSQGTSLWTEISADLGNYLYHFSKYRHGIHDSEQAAKNGRNN